MINLSWNLIDLFRNTEDFYHEIDRIRQLLSHIKRYEQDELDENLLFDLLNEKWKIKELANRILIYGSFRYYKDVKSEECIQLKAIAEKFNGEVDATLKGVDRAILDLGRETVYGFLNRNPKLRLYQLALDNLFRLQEHIRGDAIAVVKENVDSINKQISLYYDVLRDIKYDFIEIDGKKLEITSANFSQYLVSEDRETRRQTYLVVNQAFQKAQDEFATILNSIFGSRSHNAQLEHYNSVLEKVLFEENIDLKIVETLIEVVNQHLNSIQRYLKIKTDFLGIEEPHLYDLGVPLANHVKMKYSLEEAIEIIKKALEPLGDEYLKVVEELFDGHIDAIPDERKHQSITFSWNTYSFMNFRGTYIDLKNMIHELGHIVHYYLSQKHLPFIYEDSTVFVGETASIVNEILLNRYLYENAETEEERIFYLSKNIENYFTSVFKQTMYTEFENDLYSIRSSCDLTAKILSEKYARLIKKYYGDVVIYDEVSSIEWTRLGHLYRWSYYPYKYATGLMIASVVVNSLLDERSLSKEQYLKFLSSGSSLYSLDLLKMLDIDLTSFRIIEDGFKVMEKDIEELERVFLK